MQQRLSSVLVCSDDGGNEILVVVGLSMATEHVSRCDWPSDGDEACFFRCGRASMATILLSSPKKFIAIALISCGGISTL